MEFVWDALREAIRLLANNDEHVYEVAWRSLRVSGTATILALMIGVPVGALLAFNQFRGRLVALSLVNTGMGMPPIVVGLIVVLLLWRSGPLGALDLVYTTEGMIIAQTIIATPIIIGFTAASMSALPSKLRLQVYALGASRLQMLWLLVREVRLPLLAAIMTAFGAAISEVGASVMVGGNLEGETRVLTGAILLEHSQGDFGPALAFGIILLALMVAVNALFTWVQYGLRRDRWQAEGGATAEEALTPNPTWFRT
ncbi:MAG: ABC transporter permease [Dehalococcoidia bacterium]